MVSGLSIGSKMAISTSPSLPFPGLNSPFLSSRPTKISFATKCYRLSNQSGPISLRFHPLSQFSPNGYASICCMNSSKIDTSEDNRPSDPSLMVAATPSPEVQTGTWNWKGYRVRYQYSGKTGPALILIHGFGANSDHWRKNISVLAKSNRVYSIDLIGYGYSEKPNPREFTEDSFYTFDTWATQINEFCADVVKDNAFFICNSIGGVVGLQAAVMEPDVCRGIFLLNISLRMLHIKKQPWYGRPFIKSFQSLLRDTDVGKFFFKLIATPESVRSILCQIARSEGRTSGMGG